MSIQQPALIACLFITESGKRVTDETNDDKNDSGEDVSDNESFCWSFTYIFIETESDEVRHKPLPKTDSASQNGMKTNILNLNSLNMCILAAVRPAIKAGISFFCKVYYEEKAKFEWEVMFTVVKNLDALHQVITSYCIWFTCITFTTVY